MSNFSDFIGGGSASVINETIDINSAENLITLDDGRVYLKGGVTETDTTTYPDATSALAYSGTNFSLSAQLTSANGVSFDGTSFWIMTSGGTAYKYNSAGVYQNLTFSVTSQTANPQDIFWDGSHLWVLGYTQQALFKYNSSGVYQNVSVAVNYSSFSGRGATWDGTHYYVCDSSANKVVKFTASGYVSEFSTANQTINGNMAITWDGTYLWVVDSGTDTMFAYSTSGVYQNLSLNIRPQEATPMGLAAYNKDFYLTGTAEHKVFKYSPQIGVGSQGGTEYGNQNYVRIK